jgi:hypothetical protein
MEGKSTKVLEDGNLRKYADHHLNLFHLKFFRKTRKNPKSPRAGPGFFRPGPVSSRAGLGPASGRGFKGPARGPTLVNLNIFSYQDIHKFIFRYSKKAFLAET